MTTIPRPALERFRSHWKRNICGMFVAFVVSGSVGCVVCVTGGSIVSKTGGSRAR